MSRNSALSRIRTVALALVITGVTGGSGAVIATQPASLAELDNLIALDRAPPDAGFAVTTCANAFRVVNEHYLAYLPTMLTLRIEDGIAGLVLQASRVRVPARENEESVERRMRRVASAEWTFGSFARLATGNAVSVVLRLSGHPVAAAVTERVTRS
jgi:hypothetical protein